MDTSETNMKMCGQSEEIQAYGFEMGIRPPTFRHEYGVVVNERGDWFANQGHHWLPRQDQLQEMLHYSNVQQLISDFAGFVHYYDEQLGFYTARFNSSLEQLWLAFVMKKKYNKVWEGETWQTTGSRVQP